MPPRPAPIIGRKPHAALSTANNRLSAVYIGTNPSITNSPLSSSHFAVVSSPPVDIAEETLPDLPEPPSPEGSDKSDFSGGSGSPDRRRGTVRRNSSGLPSPPATNSTGSGSTRSKGDDQEILEDLRKGKERPLSLASSSGSSNTLSPPMNGRAGSQDSPGMVSPSSSSSSPMLHTARRALHRNQSSTSSAINVHERSTRPQEDGMYPPMRSPTSSKFDNDRDEDGDNDETAKYDSIRRRPTNYTPERRISIENSDALSRVKSLTQRNKMVLDKLSSYPRTTSASPRPPSSTSRLSHTRSANSAGSAGSHSRSQSHSQPKASTSRSIDDSDPHNVLSGSETERESVSNKSVSSHARSTLSSSRRAERDREREREREHRAPSRVRARTPPSPPPSRTRVPSAPDSPFAALTNSHSRSSRDRVGIGDHGRESPGPPLSTHSSPSRRKRASMATPHRTGFSASGHDEDERFVGASPYGEFGERTNLRAQSSLALVTPMADYEERRKLRDSQREHRGSRDVKEIMQAALAAVTASRRGGSLDQVSNAGSGASGGSTGRTRSRAALPFEFRNAGDSPKMTSEPDPMTPLRAPSIAYTNSNSSSHTTGSMATNLSGTSSAASHRSRPPVSATSASLRRQQKPWASEDYKDGTNHVGPPLSAGRSPRKDRHSTDYVGMAEYRERRQGSRGGSAESALLNGNFGRSLVGEGLRAAGLSRAHRLSIDTGRDLPGLSFPTEGAGDESDEEMQDHEIRARRDTIVPSRMGGTPGSRAATSLGTYHAVRESEQDEEILYDRDRDRERRIRSGRASLTPSNRERSLARDEEIDRASSVLSRYGTLRTPGSHAILRREREAGTSSPHGARRQSNQVPTSSHPQQEHTKLLLDSMAMFEGHIARLGGSSADEAINNAHTLVSLAERLNDLLRASSTRCVDEQVKAEVDAAASGGHNKSSGVKEAAEIWDSLGAEFREGLKLSDELVRTMTSFLLGVGKVVKDLGEPGVHHGRSVSLDAEGLRRRGSIVGLGSPDLFAGGGSDGRKSRESRRSSEQPRESVDAFIASRRASSRADMALGQAKPVLRDSTRHGTPPPPPPLSESSSRHSAGATSSGTGQAIRRLFTPREQRERDFDGSHHHHEDEHRPSMPTIVSQEELRNYEPSSTSHALNASQSTVRNQLLPSIPKPLPTLPSERWSRDLEFESPSTRAIDTVRDSSRRKERRTASIIIPSRVPSTSSSGGHFPSSITTPSNATTALSTHTVTNHQHTPSPHTDIAASSIRRENSDNSSSGRSQAVTFSRPSTISVSTLNGLQQKDGQRRRRRGSTGSNGAEPSTSYIADRFKEAMSGSETERPRDSNKLLRSRTLGPSKAGRASLDGQVAAIRAATSLVNAADRSAAFSAVSATARAGSTRERRRTVTDIFPQA